jgi:hypothetical protein
MTAWTALRWTPLEQPEALDWPASLMMQARMAPRQAAWTLAELFRQMDLPCQALEVAGQSLLHVMPKGQDDFLVNPWMGVPLLDLQSGEPLRLDALQRDASAWNALADAAGFPQATAEEFRNAELTLPFHPRTFYDRMVVFEQVVDVLPREPATGLRPARYGAGARIRIWPAVMEQVLPRSQPMWQWRLRRVHEVSGLLEQARRVQLMAPPGAAPEQWTGTRGVLSSTLRQADVPEGTRVLRQALEDSTWFAALAAFDAGNLQAARTGLESYLGDYTEGRWRLAARLLMAEIDAATGHEDTARAAWRDLPVSRRLYGIYRTRGLLGAGSADAASN